MQHTTAADDEATRLLDPARIPAPAHGNVSIGVGAWIGPYVLEEVIGEGGMGQVFLARQTEPIQRRVALKLIRRQIADGLSLAYFEIERQALARMEHPAIARVYDAGRTDSGFPYFVMEYIDGMPLHQWRRETEPDLRTCLTVFVALLRGVQHAHERGIVHRDLKPANVIITDVDGKPTPKLIDFGIAVGIDSGSGDTPVDNAGSPAYMSPEQFDRSMGVDARSDVYSLGLILLELLQPGRHRHNDPTQSTELRSRLQASTRGRHDVDLSTIPLELRHVLLKALAPDRDDRYDSAALFADDVQRWLESRPLLALPQTPGYLTRKFVQRHRLAVSLASLALATLVIGLVSTLWALAQAEREATRSKATADFLATVLGGVNPDIAGNLDKTLLRTVLEEASARASVELQDQPEVLTDIQNAIGDSYMGLADFPRALEYSSAAYQRTREQYGEFAAETLRQVPMYTNALTKSSDAAAAIAVLEPAIVASRREFGDDDITTLRMRQNLGIALWEDSRPADGLIELEAAAEGYARTLGPAANRTNDTRFAQSIVLATLGEYEQAVAMLQGVIDRVSERYGDDHPRTFSLRNSLGVFHLQNREFAAGEKVLKPLLEPIEQVFGSDNHMTLMVAGNLAGALRQQGKVDESGPYYQRALEGRIRVSGPDDTATLMAKTNYGNWLLDAGRIDESMAFQQEVVASVDRLHGGRHSAKVGGLLGLGRALIRKGEYLQAEALLLEVLQLQTDLDGPKSPRLVRIHEALHELYTAWGRPEAAKAYPLPD